MKKLKWKIIQFKGITMKIKRDNTEHLCIIILPPKGEVHIIIPYILSIGNIQVILHAKFEWIIDQQSLIQSSVHIGKWIKSLYIDMDNGKDHIINNSLYRNT